MKTLTAMLVLFGSIALTAAPPDKRLATASKVYITPLDELEGDKPVAACLAQHLPTALPLTVVGSKEEADVVLRVKARISGDTARKLMGALGTIQLWAVTPDGAKLWDGFTGESLVNSTALPPSVAEVPCLLADSGIEMFRKALKKARDSK